uniref:Chromosome partitioning protein ParB n=1 Tax=Schistocephalus solidus TaxID=70667 RepID=A0A183STM9_SCHSO
LVRIDDERLPKRLFDGDVATGACRQGGQKRRYTDTLTKSLKQLQFTPVTLEDLAQDRPVWSRSVKTGSAIYEANWIANAKAKRAAQKTPATGPISSMPRPFQHARTVNASSARESAWSDIFGRNAPKIRQLQFLRQILPILL